MGGADLHAECLALAARNVNRPAEALEALLTLDPDGGWIRERSVYWRFLAETYHQLGRHGEELNAARKGRRRFPDLLHAGREPEMYALAALGRTEELEEAVDDAQGVEPVYAVSSVATAIWYAARTCRAHGHEECWRSLVRKLESYLALSGPGGPDERTFQRARLHLEAGRPDSAKLLLEGLVARVPDPGPTSQMDEAPLSATWWSRLFLGIAAAQSGDRDTAMAQDRWVTESGSPYVNGWDHWFRAAIVAHLGEPERALDLLRRAFAEGVPYWPYMHRHHIAFEPLWDHPGFDVVFEPKG